MPLKFSSLFSCKNELAICELHTQHCGSTCQSLIERAMLAPAACKLAGMRAYLYETLAHQLKPCKHAW